MTISSLLSNLAIFGDNNVWCVRVVERISPSSLNPTRVCNRESIDMKYARFIGSALNRNEHDAAPIMLWTFIDTATSPYSPITDGFNDNFSDFPVANRSTVLNHARNWQTVNTRFTLLPPAEAVKQQTAKDRENNSRNIVIFFWSTNAIMVLSIIGLHRSSVYRKCWTEMDKKKSILDGKIYKVM